ncbi:MAG: hypothetical protein WEB04_01885 [Dehalococcoidia bacterium]
MRTLDPTRVQRVANGTLTALLQRYGDRAKLRGKRQSQIARDAWLDESYLSRLLSGERENPSRDAVILLGAFGLGLAVEEVDELLMAADYKPLVLPASLR